MGPLYRLPRRFYHLYDEGRLAARRRRLENPDRRTELLAALEDRRKERDRLTKIERTMQIARDYTASRRASLLPHSRAGA